MTELSADSLIPRKFYWSNSVVDPTRCPLCQSTLKEEYLIYLLVVQRDCDEDVFFVGNRGGAICLNCPIIVLKFEVFEDLAGGGINESFSNFAVMGLIDSKSMSNNSDDPAPLIPFTNNVVPYRSFLVSTEKNKQKKTQKRRKKKKIGRNDPCPCGSGVKYKKCCLRKNIQGIQQPVFNN